MIAFEVESVMVTVCAEEKVPPAGEMTGVAAVGVAMLTVKAADATTLLLSPVATPIALIVSDEATEMAEVYFGDTDEGVVPSVV